MGQPRRLLLMFVGLAFFGTAYGCYAFFLGWINGLPPLPEKYWKVADITPPQPPERIDKVARLLVQAFGPSCAELNYPIQLSVQQKGLVLATEQFTIEPDGRVRLTPVSIAMFGKPKAGLEFPEVNTVHADMALVTFDQPIQNLADMGKSRIVAAEFIGDPTAMGGDPRKGFVFAINNHQTPQPDDDMIVKMRGPLFFRDDQPFKPDVPQLWTTNAVELTDLKGKPKPTTVTAIGMRIFLTPEAMQSARGSDSKRPPPKPGQRQEDAVRVVELCSYVEMNLWLERDGFLAPGQPGAKQADPSDKAHVRITTPGPFRYNVPTDLARFEKSPRTDLTLANQVEVVRTVPSGGTDQLYSETLVIQFRRKAPDPPAGPTGPLQKPFVGPPAPPPPPDSDDRDVNLEIVSAHAFGGTVSLASDSESLAAWGSDLTYERESRTSVLVGSPMIAHKEGHEIEAQSLTLIGADPKAPQQPAATTTNKSMESGWAKGPGVVRLRDAGHKQPILVRWVDRLNFDKDEGMDLLIVVGSAVFDDRDRDQYLQADQIKLWMKPAPPASPTATAPDKVVTVGPPPKSTNTRPQPQKLIATNNVRAHSAELEIHDTDLLIVHFQTLPELPTGRPTARIVGVTPPPTAGPPTGPMPPPAGPTAPIEPPKGPAVAAASPEPPPAKRPIDLSARSVESFVFLIGERSELDKVRCEGRVKVHQDAENPKKEKPLDITSQTLDLTHRPEGDHMVVTGAVNAFAKVIKDRMTLTGQQITFDQKTNEARVFGPGTLRMPSSTDFQGNTLAEPKEILVVWNGAPDRGMYFDGRNAFFENGVQAEQENSKVLCQNMHVVLDRKVSFGQANKSGPSSEKKEDAPKVYKVICDQEGQAGSQPVTVIDITYEKGTNKLIKYQRIEAPTVAFHNDIGKLEASGPGEVRIYQPSDRTETDPSAQPAAPAVAKPAPQQQSEMTLTRVRYQGRFWAFQKERRATFTDSVRVVHTPSTDPNMTIEEEQLPKGAFALRAASVKVDSATPDANGRTHQEMIAEGKAEINSTDFSGKSDIIKYHDVYKRVIFVGTESNPAVVNRYEVRGGDPKEIRGREVWYYRLDNTFKVKGGSGLSSTQ